ncbi:signal transduction histidine kinase [Staphylococcus warneri]
MRHEHYAIDQKSLMLMSDLESTYFLGNERLLHQAISNLIINAIKYSHEASLINIELKQIAQGIQLKVTNQGDVIDTSEQSHLFERFYKRSTDDNSNGLGLAITQSIIQLHHGKIHVTSSHQDGTTFTIILPKNI